MSRCNVDDQPKVDRLQVPNDTILSSSNQPSVGSDQHQIRRGDLRSKDGGREEPVTCSSNSD